MSSYGLELVAIKHFAQNIGTGSVVVLQLSVTLVRPSDPPPPITHNTRCSIIMPDYKQLRYHFSSCSTLTSDFCLGEPLVSTKTPRNVKRTSLKEEYHTIPRNGAQLQAVPFHLQKVCRRCECKWRTDDIGY